MVNDYIDTVVISKHKEHENVFDVRHITLGLVGWIGENNTSKKFAFTPDAYGVSCGTFSANALARILHKINMLESEKFLDK